MTLIRPYAGNHPITQGFTGANGNEPPGKLYDNGLSSRLVHPVRGKLPAGALWHLHGAQDVAMPIGTPILAPAAGIVVQRGEIARFLDGSIDGELYLLLQIYRSATLQTILLFTHLSGWTAKTGQHVKAGQEIAKSGNTGRVEGKGHLHWSVHTGNPHASPGAVVWGTGPRHWDPAECLAGGKLAGRGFIKSNV